MKKLNIVKGLNGQLHTLNKAVGSFTPGNILLVFLFIFLFYNYGYFIIVDHADKIHDKRKIQANVT